MTHLINGIPSDVSTKMIEEYLEIKKRFAINDWGPGQLKGGPFAEAVLRAYQHLLGDAITPFGTDIVAAEKTRIMNRVQSAGSIDEHVRQKTVPLVRLLLDFRNNRDVAHLGNFDANGMDTMLVMTAATWITCEFIRVYGGYVMSRAQEIVDGLSVRDYPAIVEREGEIFIARHDLNAEQELLILLMKNTSVPSSMLESKVKDSNKSRVRSKLKDMVAKKLIGLDSNADYFIMPRGQEFVTKNSLLQYRP